MVVMDIYLFKYFIYEKNIYGRGFRGYGDDLQNAKTNAYNMINMCENLLVVRPNSRSDKSNKRKIKTLFIRCEKET